MADDSGIMSDARIGSLVDDRYMVIEAMASGSMGVVYKAERVPVGKLVAIKFLHATFASDAEFLARFERETRVMSKLAHPNCVSVVDFGVWDGAPYLVMEYVAGTTLRAIIDKGPLPPKRALALVRQIAAGLAHAHAQGVVHRDVKPANIMVSEAIGTGDHVRILDFGLARLRGAVGRDATQTNVVVGTPNYMAPEQTIGGGLIDARTDIYAVGVVLFEMISGDRPFHADDTLALLGMHRAAPAPRLADRVPADLKLPRGLQDLVDKAMAKSPSDRFQSAIELAAAIDEVSAAQAEDERPLLVRRSRESKKAVGMAPTMLDISDARDLVAASHAPARRHSSFGSFTVFVLFLGCVGAGVWWVKLRGTDEKVAAAGQSQPDPVIERGPGSSGGSAADGVGEGSGAAESERVPTSPAAAPGGGSAGVATSGDSGAPGVIPAGSDSPEISAAPDAPHDASASTPPSDGSAESPSLAGNVAGAGSGSDIEMDPATAEDPAPAASKPPGGDDEAANAPATVEEAERHTPAAPVLASTLEGSIQLIKDGKRDLALASLRALWKKAPSSSYIPFLLGNLYFDQHWWAVAMDHYTAAIRKNAKYRWNPTLNRNVIRMLASVKTSRKAQGFLRYTVGKPALPFVRYAAQHDANGQVKRITGWLAKNI